MRHLQKCKIKPIIEKLKKEKDIEIQKLKKEKDAEIEKLKKENNELRFEIVSLKAENNIFSKGHQEIMKLAKQPKTTKNNNFNHKKKYLFLFLGVALSSHRKQQHLLQNESALGNDFLDLLSRYGLALESAQRVR